MSSVGGAALVTGGAKRVGRALCLRLAAEGYAVGVHHRGPAEAAEALVHQIRSGGGRAAAVQADLSDSETLAGLMERTYEAIGPLTLLVNNASTFQEDEVMSVTAESFRAHMAPNLLAPLLLTQAFARQAQSLRSEADPNVINIVDQRVLRPTPHFLSYSLSKAALYAATTLLAQALAPRIRVNAVAPGPTLPSIHQEGDAFLREVSGVPLQRPADLDDIASAVMFLASAPSVTGQMIAVDAGQHIGWRTPDVEGQ